MTPHCGSTILTGDRCRIASYCTPVMLNPRVPTRFVSLMTIPVETKQGHTYFCQLIRSSSWLVCRAWPSRAVPSQVLSSSSCLGWSPPEFGSVDCHLECPFDHMTTFDSSLNPRSPAEGRKSGRRSPGPIPIAQWRRLSTPDRRPLNRSGRRRLVEPDGGCKAWPFPSCPLVDLTWGIRWWGGARTSR
jgi:hypothetical protein